MPDGVVARVEEMGCVEKQPIFGRNGPVFEWEPGVVIEEEEDEIYEDPNGDEGSIVPPEVEEYLGDIAGNEEWGDSDNPMEEDLDSQNEAPEIEEENNNGFG